MTEPIDISTLRTFTKSLVNHVYWIKQKFHLLPDREHLGTSINYIDLQEFREEFCEELVNTIPDWFYSKKNIAEKLNVLMTSGRTEVNAQTALRTAAFKKFRNRDSREVVVQGQFGELVLFNFLQHFFEAVPLIRKMPLTTSTEMERFGADAVHYALNGTTNVFYLGEAKTYSSKYQFNTAFKDAIESILKTYQNHRKEISLYIEEEFISEELKEIAAAYKNGTIKNLEIHLVSIIIYNETKSITANSEQEIKNNILKAIEERCEGIDKELFNLIEAPLQLRFNYIIFPVWKLDELLQEFQKLIGK